MISRFTSSIAKEHLVFPDCCRVVQGTLILVAGASRYFHLPPTFPLALQRVPNLIIITPMVLLYESLEIPGTLNGDWNALQWSDTLLKLTTLSSHSTFSQTLLDAPSN